MVENTPTAVFEDPPITEVAIGVSFEPLPRFKAVHLGAWWQTIQDPYSLVEQHPPLAPTLDRFPGDAPASAPEQVLKFSLPLGVPDSFPRHWFSVPDKSRLIQVQQDRFFTNWRKIRPDDKYPQYNKSLRPEFEKRWGQLREFIEKQDLGVLKVLQAEVLYVNTVTHEGDLSELIAPWCGKFSSEIPPLEGVGLHTGFLIPGVKGRVQQQVASSPEEQKQYQITVMARIRPDNPGADALLKWVDLSHEWAVRAFTAFTTERMHRIWKRTR